ncbi:MFS general substrate transporter [Cylindrobasidium torrendii FP15055 ss-10]|uniref:MFS general substrate transporter n=1 Tax=Cylindrobasidium torrendii FP15055 ss-10 TaxID=1314674 RepID=A0A0D7AWN8_9AGAR|nr:MFS general substrate transporter [Cylindrobasidium torrendii FP15055 ss-10]
MSDSDSASLKKRPLRSYFWDTWDKSPEERKFLGKLDACLLTYAALSYFSKYLDQQNVTNAYVSGMKEDLGLHGNQLNYITTAWTCGYVIGQIPSNLLITRIRPSIWIPAMEVIWSTLTMVLASTKSFEQLVAIRFFVGLAESSFYPAMQYVIGSWYRPEELGKRACIFHTASSIGPMFSGFLQTGAYNGLNGVHGLAGWKWLFIIDGIITLPIALLGFYIMPDLPHNTRPSKLYTQEQLDLAQRRMVEIGRKPPAKFTKAKFNNGNGPSTSMIFWLKSFLNPDGTQKYTVGQINTYPLGINAIAVVLTLIYAWTSDALGSRCVVIVFAGLGNMSVAIALAATPVYEHITRRWALYYLTSFMGGISGIIMAWANELNGHDSEKRAFVVASCNMFAYVFQAWLPIVIFPQVEQPRVLKGNIVTAGISAGMIFFAITTLVLQKRDARRKKRNQQSADTLSDGVAGIELDEDDTSVKKLDA